MPEAEKLGSFCGTQGLHRMRARRLKSIFVLVASTCVSPLNDSARAQTAHQVTSRFVRVSMRSTQVPVETMLVHILPI